MSCHPGPAAGDREESSVSFVERKPFLLVLLFATIALLVLRLWHLRADFPDASFYGNYHARFTDEGFYTGAALHYFTFGRVYIPGGWNPGVFMPVWPAMVGLLFHFTGISVEAARGLAMVCTWISVPLAYAVARQYRSTAFATISAFLIAANALGFFFGRLAFLEPAFVMWLLLAIYLAAKIRAGNYADAVGIGIVFTLLTLTKTTAPFVLPAILYPIWANHRTRPREAWRLLAAAIGTIAILLGSAKIIWLLHYRADAQIIFALSPWWQLEHAPPRFLRFFYRGTWIDPVLFPLALACIVAAVVRLRFLRRDTLFLIALLWEAGYAAFIAFHYDGPPRYFVTLIVPTIWLALILTEWLWQHHRHAALVVAACIAASVAGNLFFIGRYLLHPRYALVNASQEIKQRIAAERNLHPAESDLLIGRGAEEISLLSNGTPAIDSDGAMPLTEKLDVYQPDWFMIWTNDPPQRAMYVAGKRRMVPQAYFPNLDRRNHAGIILYRLSAKVSP